MYLHTRGFFLKMNCCKHFFLIGSGACRQQRIVTLSSGLLYMQHLDLDPGVSSILRPWEYIMFFRIILKFHTPVSIQYQRPPGLEGGCGDGTKPLTCSLLLLTTQTICRRSRWHEFVNLLKKKIRLPLSFFLQHRNCPL